MKKLLARIGAAALVVAAATGATLAFFSDTETSVGNEFTAGEVDLTVGNATYYNLVSQDGTGGTPDLVFGLTDLNTELFFDFSDLKPGDIIENTMSLRVDDNDSWICANMTPDSWAENGVNDSEEEDGDNPALLTAWDGELQDEVNYIIWGDDGDNVLEDDETVFDSGNLNNFPQTTGGTFTIADFDDNNTYGGVNGDPVPGTTAVSIAAGFCFGTLTPDAMAQGANSPTVDPGFDCDGSLVDNVSQTDDVTSTLAFYAVQSRNNASFDCTSWTP